MCLGGGVVLCQGGQEHSDDDSYLEHEGPDDNAEVLVHVAGSFRAATLARGSQGLCR